MADTNGSDSTASGLAAQNALVEASDPEARALAAQFRALQTDILLARAQFMRQAGITYEGERDEYAVLGYDRIVTDKQYRDEYARGGIAGRVVDVMPDATWRGDPPMELVEDEDPDKDTQFEKAWQDLDKKHQICGKCYRVDKLARLSTYAVLLIGAAGSLDQELPKGKPEGLLYLRPCSGGGGPSRNRESQAMMSVGYATASVYEYEIDPQNPRFGLPRSYQLRDPNVVSVSYPPVHWSRIIHVAEGLLDDDVFGVPALERVWNLLIDLRKVTGGGAEAFWLRANQGMHLDIDKDMSLPNAKDTIDKLREQVEAYKHGLDRWLRTRGVNVTALGSDVANFAGPADAILTQIAGAKAIPKRILTGSEMGELASSQDRENFRDQIIGRQTQYAAPYIVRPLVDRFIAYGYLPTPKKGPDAYTIRWSHTQVMTEQEKTAGAQAWAAVNASYGDVVFTDDEIREKWADKVPLTDEQRQAIMDAKMEKAQMAQEAMADSGGVAPAAEDDEDPGKKPPKKVLPFQRRAAQRAQEAELLKVLEAAITAGNTDVVAQIMGLEHAYASTQVQLPPDVAERLFAIGRAIPDEDIYEPEGGRETDAHVTVRYGLIDADPKKLYEVVARRGSQTMVLGATGMFSTPKYDVVFVDVHSLDLAALHAAISVGVPCKENDYGVYHPHATVAYVKPGTGYKYVGNTELDGTVVTVDKILLCGTDDSRTEVSLLG